MRILGERRLKFRISSFKNMEYNSWDKLTCSLVFCMYRKCETGLTLFSQKSPAAVISEQAHVPKFEVLRSLKTLSLRNMVTYSIG